MIKLESIDPEQSTPEYYLSSPLSVDGNIIPINLNTPLVNELGKNLLKAAAEGDIEEIRQLLTKGAPFTADWLGTSPLHLAAQGNHAEICELLLSAGISPNARTKVDRTPLHMAACEGHMEIVELLLGADADVDCTDLLGMTPLHWASQNGHADIVYVLLKSNAKVDIANKFSLKPVDVAGQIGRLDIVRMLEEQRDFQQHEDPTTAAEYLAMEMAAEDEQSSSPTTSENVQLCSPSSQTMDVLADEDEDTGDATDHDIRLDLSDPHQTANSVSMKILQEHGITMLPNDDDNNILSTVMETGHSVVLTDVGKQMLDCVKASEEAAEAANRKALKTNNNYITVTADELLMMATNASISKNQTQIVRKLNGKYVPKTIKKIVMTRNKLQPISPAPNQILRQKATFQPIQNAAPSASSDRSTASLTGSRSQVAVLTKQLEEAKRTIEEYKLKLLQKEAEVEEYKQQLRLLGYS